MSMASNNHNNHNMTMENLTSKQYPAALTRTSDDEEDDDDASSKGDNSGSEAESSYNGKSGAAAAAAGKGGAEEHEVIAKEETRAVLRLKFLLLAVLICSTVGVALGVAYYMSRAEQAEFEDRYDDAAAKVFESVGTSLHLTLGAVDALVVDQVSFARFTNMTWPFVVIPDYAVRVAKIRALSHAFIINQYHLVTGAQRNDWQAFAKEQSWWVDESINIQKADTSYKGKIVDVWNATYEIHNNTGPSGGSGPFLPQWQQSPIIPVYSPYNWNGAEYSPIIKAWDEIFVAQRVVISEVANLPDPNDAEAVIEAGYTNDWAKDYLNPGDDPSEPQSDIYYPMLDRAVDAVGTFQDNVSGDLKTVGILTLTLYWRELIKDILPSGTHGLVAVIGNECGQSFTYQINGPQTIFLGRGDLHDPKYDDKRKYSSFINLKKEYGSSSTTYTGLPLSQASCPFWISVYPSAEMEDMFVSNNPVIFGFASASIFLFTSIVFLLYDFLVERRQRKVLHRAVQTSAIVSSLFPSVVRDRLFKGDERQNADKNFAFVDSNKNRLKTFLRSDADKEGGTASSKQSNGSGGENPIADLFPDATVMFADIAGFTAWSSVRQPSQVFLLLETLYGEFDQVAARRGVFKVETIGDSYVAVAGLPEPREDHVVVMAKFAADCRAIMQNVTRELETTLGPETGDLCLRIGLNSGPVTAGVLRGQKSRFQLFGDTVNTAARMESTGLKNRIQVSQSTADLLIQAKKGHWVKPREEVVEAKGKGKMKTYWIEPRTHTSSVGGSSRHDSDNISNPLDDKTQRLVHWNVDMMSRIVRQIIAQRNAMNSIVGNRSKTDTNAVPIAVEFPTPQGETGKTVIDEFKEIIELPEFDPIAFKKQEDPEKIELALEVMDQLRNFVVAIAATYNKNPFHNFEHASHVTMSVIKLLSRIVAADKVYEDSQNQEKSSHTQLAASLHGYTYGITSDPLTQFACVFAALVHDADHQGVPNTVLVKENSELSQYYKGKSVAEQNSVDVALSIFAQRSYAALRGAVCPTEEEARRFRQLVINAVMATDIMDKDLKDLRNERWQKAFQEGRPSDVAGKSREDINRKATIVIEHLMQASDVAHTMQHWHIYRKWNERLFEEMYLAYKNGRTDADPSNFWYKGEIGFFDFYIIPLAKKLSECGVFGVSSDECLNYAQKNREEWIARGEEVVAQMVEKLASL